MRRIAILSLIVLLCLPISATKRALLIGVGNYPQNSGWQKISSVNDIVILEQVLSHDFMIETLIDQQATRMGIDKAFKRIISNCSKGDTVLIHFSCHGQQLLSSQQDEPDGLDEALVPYDANSTKTKTYKGENHLLDNDLARYWESIRKRLGSNGLLVVTLDACYSDSNHKGKNKTDSIIYRGGADIFGSNELSKDSLIKVKEMQQKRDESAIESIDDAANIIIMSACETFQKNREIRIDGQGYGCLSYSMFKTFESHNIKEITTWLDTVFEYMNEYGYTQTPQVRSTIGYISPKQREAKISKDNKEPFSEEEKDYKLIIAIGLSLLFILLFAIWKQKRRR